MYGLGDQSALSSQFPLHLRKNPIHDKLKGRKEFQLEWKSSPLAIFPFAV